MALQIKNERARSDVQSEVVVEGRKVDKQKGRKDDQREGEEERKKLMRVRVRDRSALWVCKRENNC